MRRLGLPGSVAGALAFVISGVAGSATPQYVGAARCKTCHLKEYRSWEKTRMAHTYELLLPGVAADAKRRATLDPNADYTRNTKCLSCHTTGYGKPGGFVSMEKTPQLANVGCEACHGAGSEYLKEHGMTMANKAYHRADLVKLGLNIPDRATCAAVCHNNKSPFRGPDFVFDYNDREKRGSHTFFALKYAH